MLSGSRLITLRPSLIAHRWVGPQTQWRPRHKAIYSSRLGPEPFCVLLILLLVQLLVFFCSSVPVVLFDTPGISRCRSQHVVSVEPSSLFHHSIYPWFIFSPWWSMIDENFHADRTTIWPYFLRHNRSWMRGRDPVKLVYTSPPLFYYWPFQAGTSVMVSDCYLFLPSVFKLWFTYYVSDTFYLSSGSWMTTCLGKSCLYCLPRVPFVNCCQFMYLVLSLLVLMAGYGIWLHQFLIIAYLFTWKTQNFFIRSADSA